MPIDVAGRIHDRRRVLRRRRLRLILIAAVLLALGGAGGWAVWASPLFAARVVAVQGTALLTPDAVRAAAAVPLGRPLPGIETGPVAERVRGLVQVDAVEVTRQYPATIVIKLRERTVAFTVAVPSGFAWVDATGHQFNVTKTRPPGAVLASVRPEDGRLLAAVGTVVHALPDGVRKKTKTVRGNTPDSIVLDLTSGAQVVWGSSEQSELKGQVLLTLLTVKARNYDVSAPAQPTTRA